MTIIKCVLLLIFISCDSEIESLKCPKHTQKCNDQCIPIDEFILNDFVCIKQKN